MNANNEINSSFTFLNKELSFPISVNSILDHVKNSEFQHDKWIDPYLNLKNVLSDKNVLTDGEKTSSVKKDDSATLASYRQWKQAKLTVPPPQKLHGLYRVDAFTDLILENFSLSVGKLTLIRDSSISIIKGHTYGLIGRNGTGKTTLLSAIAGKHLAKMPKGINIAMVEQEFDSYLSDTLLDIVLAADQQRLSLLSEVALLESKDYLNDEQQARLMSLHEKLICIGADKAEAEASTILSGLGLKSNEIKTLKLKELSGGNRMRVMLARALFAEPDILCLDEPTNHLDIYATAWLINYIKNNKLTCIIVSHSKDFLNEVCTDIYELTNHKLVHYKGNFDSYEKIYEERLKHQKKHIKKQEASRKALQAYVDKYRCSTRSAQAQSRLKKLEKLPDIEEILTDPTLSYDFPAAEEISNPLIVFKNVSFSYSNNDKYILADVDLNITNESRMTICGPNGCGKSTLLKLICGTLIPKAGFIHRNINLKIGYFSQHHIDDLDLTINAVEHLKSRFAAQKVTDQEARTFLARFGIHGTTALEPMCVLSGGQKSRISFATIAFSEPHMLVLDEPTNHQDFESIRALIAAINCFQGAVIVVSHDSYLLDCISSEIYYMQKDSNQLKLFKGEFSEFMKQVLSKTL